MKNGQPIVQQVIHSAVFRCDTFVNFCYKEGFNVILPTSTVVLPKSTFDSFINKRMDVQENLSKETLGTLNKKLTNALNENAWLKLDIIVEAYLANPNLSEEDKILDLWKLAQKYQHNPAQFGYLIDTLAMLKSAYLVIPGFVKLYAQQTLVENKQKLIFAIMKASEISNTDFKLSLGRKQAIGQAQNFLIKTIKNEKNPLLLNQALKFSGMILPATVENYLLINEGKEQFKKISENTNYPKQYFSMLSLSMALANADMQRSQLPILLKKPRSLIENKDFNASLFILLKDVNPDKIINSSQQLLKQYIKNQIDNNKYLEVNYLQAGSRDINALYALATVNSHDKIEKNEFVKSYLIKSRGVNQAWLISQANSEIISAINQVDINSIKKKLQFELKNSKNANFYLIYANAITRLNSVK